MFALAMVLALAQEPELLEPRPFPPEPLRLSNVGFGPLRLASQSPFRAALAAEAPSSLSAGRWEIRETATWSRMWGQSDEYLLSFETLNRTLSVLHGLTDRLQAEVGVVSSSRFGGDLDGFVKNFHDAFGIGQGGRDTVSEGAYHFRVGEVDIPELRVEDSAERLFAGLRWTVAEGDRDLPALAAAFSLFHEDEVGASASLTAAKGWGDVHAYLGADIAWYGQGEFYGLELRPYGMSVRTAVEWRAADRLSFVLQYVWTLGALVGQGTLSRPTHELGLGVKAEVVDGSVFELGVTENVVVFDNSPDFGLHAGMAVRF